MYKWNCTEPDADGLRYIPSLRDHNVLSATTVGNELNIYQLPANLCENCYGRVVGIEYCYQFSTTAAGPAVFNWTVLILEKRHSEFTILDTISIESCSDVANCSEPGKCCDVTNSFTHLNLTRKFTFGVTESSEGNTHNASLLGFADARSQYRVNTTKLGSAGLSLSVGSDVPSVQVAQTGIRMLWFVVVPNQDIGNIQSRLRASNSSTNGRRQTCEQSTESDETEINTTRDDDHDLASTVYAMPEASVGGLVGGVFGGVIGLTVVIVVVIIVLIVIKKRQQTGKYNANGKGNDNAGGYINAVYACDGKARNYVQ